MRESTLQDHYRITATMATHPVGVIYGAIDLRNARRVLIAELPAHSAAGRLDLDMLIEAMAPGGLVLDDYLVQAGVTYLVVHDLAERDDAAPLVALLDRVGQPLHSPYGPPPPVSPYAKPAPGTYTYALHPQLALAPSHRASPFNTTSLVALGAGLTLGFAFLCVMGVLIQYQNFSTLRAPMMGSMAASVVPSVTLSNPLVAVSNPPAPTRGGVPSTTTAYSIQQKIEEADVGPVAYAPDGAMIAVGVGQVIQLYVDQNFDLDATLVGHHHTVSVLTFSPDSALLASSAQDEQEVIIWDVATGRERMRLQGHTGWVRSLAFSPDGALLASGSTDTSVRLWDVASGEMLGVLRGHTDYLGNIAFSPDGRFLASAARDGTVRMWDVASQAPLAGFAFTAPINSATGAPYWLTGIAYSPDGTSIAVGSVSNSIYILDAISGQLERELRGHQDWIVIHGLSYSPDGKTLASASTDGTLRLWNPITGTERAVLRDRHMRLLGLSWAPDSHHVVTVSDTGGMLTLWDTQDRAITKRLLLAQGMVQALAYSESGEILGTGGASGMLRLHSLADERQVSINGALPTNQFLAFLSDRELIAISDAGEVVVIDLSGQDRNQELQGVEGVAVSVVVSRDRSLIAAGSNTGQVVIWDAQTFTPIQTLQGPQEPALLLAFSRDGSRLAVATNYDESGDIQIWNARSGAKETRIEYPQTQITAMDLAALGDMLVSASSNGTLTFWRTADGSPVRTIHAPTNERWFNSLALSPNGNLLVTGSLIGSLEFWDVQTGTRLGGISLTTGSVMAIAFHPDGNQIAVSTFDGGIYLLQITD